MHAVLMSSLTVKMHLRKLESKPAKPSVQRAPIRLGFAPIITRRFIFSLYTRKSVVANEASQPQRKCRLSRMCDPKNAVGILDLPTVLHFANYTENLTPCEFRSLGQ